MVMPPMISLLVVTVAVVYADDSFSPVDQAIWIDRLNYFRTTGLPWSAANMQQMKWKPDLAKTAASSAAKCSATTGPGVNVFQSSSSSKSSIIDEAIQQWVVETSKKTLRTIAQPGASGVEIGKGTYNSYSQIVWAPTSSVGCASASCSGSQMVVCQFSPPGNDRSSPWYVHGKTASKCPSGTKAAQGLCVAEGDAGTKPIASIPAGKLTYEVYPAFVAKMQTVLVEAARGIANGEKPPTVTTPTTAAPTAKTPTPSSSSSKTPSNTPSSSSSKDVGGTNTDATEKTPSSLKTTISVNKDVGGTKTSATDKTPSSSISDNYGLETSSPSTESGKTSTSTSKKTDKTSTPSSTETSTEKNSPATKVLPGDDLVPGTVKASSDDGSTFTNEETSTKNETSSSPTSAPSTGNGKSNTANTPMSDSGSVTGANHKALGVGISLPGIAGIVVLGIVGIAAFGVVMSYKRNQQRQREIMRDGGIRVN